MGPLSAFLFQYGVFTPIFKTHSTKDQKIVRYPWAFPDHMFHMRNAIRLRYDLVPYIYNASRENYDTGVAMCRPMYYDYPELDKAYSSPEQFMFGNDILATAVVQPVDKVTGLAKRTIWFPEGAWYDFATGAMYEGDACKELQYTIAENPWFAKAGSIIPMNPSDIDNLQKDCGKLVLTFVPGGDGELRLYEDDGLSQDYMNGGAWTNVEKKTEGNVVKICVAAREGTYAGALESRAFELRLPAMYPPVSVKVNGEEVSYMRFAEGTCWTYDAYTLAPVIYVAQQSCASDLDVELVFDEYAMADQKQLYGLSGVFKRAVALTGEFKFEQGKSDSYLMLPVEYLKVAQCPNFILEDPFKIAEFIEEYKANKSAFYEMVEQMTMIGDEFKEKLKSQMTIVE